MKIEYQGHASFRITTGDGTTIMTDPYVFGYRGLSFGQITQPADIVTISHEHGDHNGLEGLSGNPQAVRAPGVHEVKGIKFTGISSFHDEQAGAKRGPNIIYAFTIDGLRLCHLGDVGHLLDDQQRTTIGAVDVLFIPVGGFYTVTASEAGEIADTLQPKVIIPMHFKSEKCSFPITPVDDFTAGKENVKIVSGSEVEITRETLPSKTQIIVLKPSL